MSETSTTYKKISLGDDCIGQRLDVAIATILMDLPRTKIQALIKKGKVYREDTGQALKPPSLRLKSTYDITIELSDDGALKLSENSDIPLDIIFEDDDIIVINKQTGLVVHPGAGQKDDTLVNALLHHTNGQLSNLSGDDRPGILHRLDKDTTGLMVIAKNNDAHASLAEQIKTRDMKRTYQSIVWGTPSPREDTIETQYGRDENKRTKMAVLTEGGKTAITHFHVAKPLGLHNSLIECRLETGRTHQIRVHMMHLGFPVVGDQTYRIKNNPLARLLSKEAQTAIANLKRQTLHAFKLEFMHPKTQENMTFTCPLPDDMVAIINVLS